MNKKISSLIVAFLAATCFSASAADFKSGGSYLLKRVKTDTGTPTLAEIAAATDYLAVKGDSLTFVDAKALNHLQRDSATWIISEEKTASGGSAYTFKNKATGKDLSIADTTGRTLAASEGGIGAFVWNPAGSAILNKSKGNIYIVKGFTLANECTMSATNFKDFATADNGYLGAHILKMRNLRYTPIDVYGEEDHAEAKQIVKNIDAILAEYGLDRNSEGDGATYKAAMKEYKKWAEDVEAWDNNCAKISVSSILKGAFDNSPKAGRIIAATRAGVLVNVNGVWHGAISGDIGDELNGIKFAAGTIFIKDCYERNNLFVTDELTDRTFDKAGDINFTYGRGDRRIEDAEDDPSYPDDFTNDFITSANQPDSTIAIRLDFEKDATAPKATDNILEGKSLRFVVKNLLIGEDGLSDGGADTADYRSSLMIQDTVTGKYLYVSDEKYDESKTSTNFKLQWVNLKDLSKYMTIKGAARGVSYNNICDDEGKVLPHAGSAIFNVSYNPTDSNIVINPRWLYLKETEVADSTGNYPNYVNGGDSDVHLSLKKFGNEVALSFVDQTSVEEPEYKIYVKGAGEDMNYTKATTESDIYLIQHVSGDAVKNGKYYTADGMKDLTEFDANNHAENQWALFTDEEDSTVTIINRATTDTLLIGETAVNGIVLYKGINLKADVDSYVTLPGGDTVKLTPVDSTYRLNAGMGNFAYNKEFNPVSYYRFTYFNNLDNSKKLNIAKDSTLFVDSEGGSAEFALATKDTIYGAPAIPGKSVALKKAIYTMSTEIGKDTFYVALKNGKYAITKNAMDAARFDLQEMTVEGDNNTTWYTFVESDRSGKASVDDNTLQLFKEELTETRTSMFAISVETYDIYRHFGSTIEDGIAKNDTAYVEFFKANEPNRYLYENSNNIVAGIEPDGLGYLGMYNKGDMTRNASIFVDPACVADTVVMPTYMMAMDVTAEADTLSGRYLVSLTDSTARTSATYNGYTRLAFVDAKHVGDSLIIATANDTIALTRDLNKASFAYELTSKIADDNADADFYIKNVDGYVWVNNGVPVLTENKEKAVVFNARKTSVVPTANEEITADGITVIGGEGFALVKGAEGKKVVATNVLGRTIASMVAPGDEVRITAPAGIVLVKVEGEPAIKVIVK